MWSVETCVLVLSCFGGLLPLFFPRALGLLCIYWIFKMPRWKWTRTSSLLQPILVTHVVVGVMAVDIVHLYNIWGVLVVVTFLHLLFSRVSHDCSFQGDKDNSTITFPLSMGFYLEFVNLPKTSVKQPRIVPRSQVCSLRDPSLSYASVLFSYQLCKQAIRNVF